MRNKVSLETHDNMKIKTANKHSKNVENKKKYDDTASPDSKSEAYKDLLVTVDVGDILFLPQSTELEEMEIMDTRAVASGDGEAKTDIIKCNQCKYETGKETTIKNHIQSMHELFFNCEMCPFVCA